MHIEKLLHSRQKQLYKKMVFLQFALMETVTTAILDKFPNLRQYKVWIVLCVAIFGYIGGLIFTTNVRLNYYRSQLSEIVIHNCNFV